MEKTRSKLDELLTKRGSGHDDTFKGILNKLNENISETSVFREESQKVIDIFAKDNSTKFPAILANCFELYINSVSSRAPGHEASHILEVINSANRAMTEYEKAGEPISEVEKLEVILACMGHDLGRYTEPYFPNLGEKQLEILIPFVLGRKVLKKQGIPEELGKRVMYDIASASERRTGHRSADIVHQADREQLGGSVMLPRLVALGIGELNWDLTLPENYDQYEDRLPNIYTERTEDMLLRLEFWMRNVYPPVSPKGEVVHNEQKLETAVLLMLGLHGMNDKLRVVFSPELGLVTDPVGFKKPLDPELFKQAQKEYESFMAENSVVDSSLEGSLQLAYKLMKSEKIVIPDTFEKFFKERHGQSSAEHNRNRALMMNYALIKRHERRVKELQELDGGTTDTVSGVVKSWIRDELADRERIYTETTLQS